LDININRCRNNNFNIVVKISVWNNLEVNTNNELDTKFIQAALVLSFSRVEEIKNNRIKELLEMKSKIKNDPIVVENWFDKEINKK
jgi:hypothetical protein